MVAEATAQLTVPILFSIGYLGIIFEHPLKINKTICALVMASLCWLLLFSGSHQEASAVHSRLSDQLASVSEVIFFLIGALSIVEVMNAHGSLNLVLYALQMRSKSAVLWTLGAFAFVLSP